MKRFATVLLGALAATAFTVPIGPVADAAVGEVVVFSAEFEPLVVFENPDGCYEIPTRAHVLTNRTDTPVTIHAKPGCLGFPIMTVDEDSGSRLPSAAASFRV